MRTYPFACLVLLGCLMFTLGCGSSRVPPSPGEAPECDECPNAKLNSPKPGPSETINPLFVSWEPYPLGTRIEVITRYLEDKAPEDKTTGDNPKEKRTRQTLTQKSPTEVILEQTEEITLSNGEVKTKTESKTIPSVIPRSSWDPVQLGGITVGDPVRDFKLGNKIIVGHLRKSQVVDARGTCEIKTWFAWSTPGMKVRQETWDQQMKLVESVELAKLEIPGAGDK